MIDINDILHPMKLNVRVILYEHLKPYFPIDDINDIINSIETDITQKTYKEVKKLLSQHFQKLANSLKPEGIHKKREKKPKVKIGQVYQKDGVKKVCWCECHGGFHWGSICVIGECRVCGL